MGVTRVCAFCRAPFSPAQPLLPHPHSSPKLPHGSLTQLRPAAPFPAQGSPARLVLQYGHDAPARSRSSRTAHSAQQVVKHLSRGKATVACVVACLRAAPHPRDSTEHSCRRAGRVPPAAEGAPPYTGYRDAATAARSAAGAERKAGGHAGCGVARPRVSGLAL